MKPQFYIELNLEGWRGRPAIHAVVGPFNTADEALAQRSDYGPPQGEVVEAGVIGDLVEYDHMTPTQHIEYMKDRY
jgi:hypothetical protein